MASTSTSPSRLSLTPPRSSSRQPRPLPAELVARPFTATSTRRDLTTSFKCMQSSFRLLDDAPVLHEQASRLAQRAVDVLGAAAAALERIELSEAAGAAGAAKVMARTHEYSPNGNGADTVFRIQSLMIDIQAFSNDYSSTCTKDRLRLLVHDIPATHAALATLNKSLLSVITFYHIALATTAWESEDALDRETDLAALPRLFRVAIALRGPVYDEFLLEQPAAPGAGRRRDEFIEWALGKNEHLRPKEGTTPVRAWTLPSPPVSPQNAVPARTPSAVPYRYGPTGRRPDSIVSFSSKSSLLPSPVMSQSTSTSLPAAANPPSPASDASSFPDSPTALYNPLRKGSILTIDEDLITPSAPGSPAASFSAFSQASSDQSHQFPLLNSDKDSYKEDSVVPSRPLSLAQNMSEEVLAPVVEATGAAAPSVEDVETPAEETQITAVSADDYVSEPAEVLPEPEAAVEGPPLGAIESLVARTPAPVEVPPPTDSPKTTPTLEVTLGSMWEVEDSSLPVAEFTSSAEERSPHEAAPATKQVEPNVAEVTPPVEDVASIFEGPSAPALVEPVAPVPILTSPVAPKDVEEPEKRLSVRIPPILTLRPATPLEGAEDSRPSSPTTFVRVLCLDGGGIRGLPLLLTLRSALASLAPTPSSPCPRPCEQFDLITGVGTGGLCALLLGRLRLSLDDAIELYICIAEMAFRGKDRTATRSRWSKLFGSSGDSEGRDANLVRALKAYLPEAPMNDDDNSPCRTAVLAFQNGKPRWLRSEDDDDERDALTVQQVARATLASSPFFRPFHATPSVTFTDTGTSPNPSEATIDEVGRSFGPGASIACFLSLGIGKVSLSGGKDAPKGTKPSKTRLKSLRFVAELEVQGSRAAERFRGRARKEGFEDQLLRYSVDAGKVDPGVDEWAALKPMAAAVEGWMSTSHSLGSSSPLWRGFAGERLGLENTRSKKSRSGVRRSMSVGNLVDGSGMFLHHATGSTGSLV